MSVKTVKATVIHNNSLPAAGLDRPAALFFATALDHRPLAVN